MLKGHRIFVRSSAYLEKQKQNAFLRAVSQIFAGKTKGIETYVSVDEFVLEQSLICKIHLSPTNQFHTVQFDFNLLSGKHRVWNSSVEMK